VGEPYARPPRARPRRCRGHHGPARAGDQQRRGSGRRRGPHGGPFQPRRVSRGRSLHVRSRKRRRSDGRGRERGLRPGRSPGPGKTHRPARRQPDLAGGDHGPHLYREPGPALRGFRLARTERRGRKRPRRHRRGNRGGQEGNRQALPHLRADGDRLRLAP